MATMCTVYSLCQLMESSLSADEREYQTFARCCSPQSCLELESSSLFLLAYEITIRCVNRINLFHENTLH